MKLKRTVSQIALLLSALPMAALAGEGGVTYMQIGTTGLGLGYARTLTDDLALRGQINGVRHSFSGDVGDFGSGPIDVQLKMATFMVIGDWYPSGGGLRVSGGMAVNQNKIDINASGATIMGKPGVAATVEVKMGDALSPYLGIGYSTRPKDAKGFGFTFDVGVLSQTPKINLKLVGGGVTQADADAQLVKVRDALHNFRYMPVLGIGITYGY